MMRDAWVNVYHSRGGGGIDWGLLGDYRETMEMNLGLAVVTAIVGLWALQKERSDWTLLTGYDRMQVGLCPTCSYDLTGSASGVCP